MPRLGPTRRTDLIQYLGRLGFDGPFSGGKHQIMRKGDITVRIPNPHRGDLSANFVARLLRQAGVSRQEWERL